VQKSDGSAYASSVGAAFYEVSAKTKEMIEEVFLEISRRLIARVLKAREKGVKLSWSQNEANVRIDH